MPYALPPIPPPRPVTLITASGAGACPAAPSAAGPVPAQHICGLQGGGRWRRPALHRFLPALAAAAVLAVAADPAWAQAAGGGGDITTFLQNLVNIITGTAGRLLAVLAICVVGVGALLGAISMRTVGGVLLGVMLIFSSAWLIDQIIGA
ncbi:MULTISPECIES: TrbC/VirB2 family protein [unclassified Azospirillum]|uniref:TrbC/VirB2 family protein n=1 Tax=unclassified Azospirillum TaxID=2630922 RepID=UPI000D64D9C9|nr:MULTISPECIES: TrbC/VirB2 family protein [unclassified Azospirillum]QCG93083.1 hypothetical protein E6C67_03835 [Azospirillum sp. TSA2s]